MRALIPLLLPLTACGAAADLATNDGSDSDGAPDSGSSPCGALGESCCGGGGTICDGTLKCAAGTCGCAQDADCPANGMCTAGRCVIVLARDQPGPYKIALDRDNVYWANQGYIAPNTIAKVSLNGGTATTLASYADNEGYGAGGLAVASGRVYWTTGNALMAVPVAGGVASKLASGTPAWLAGDVVTDGTSVYWDEFTAAGLIMKMPLAGGPPVTLASVPASNIEGLAVDGENVYWTNDYNTMEQPGTILAVPVGGGPVTTLLSLHPWGMPLGVAVDRANLYFSEEGEFQSAPLSGGTPTTLVTGVQIGYFAVDAKSLYWEDDVDGTILKAPLAGGTPVTLYTGDVPSDVTVDDTSVYWTSAAGGTVMRLSPK